MFKRLIVPGIDSGLCDIHPLNTRPCWESWAGLNPTCRHG